MLDIGLRRQIAVDVLVVDDPAERTLLAPILLVGLGLVFLTAAVFSTPSPAEVGASSDLAKSPVGPGLKGPNRIDSRQVVIRSSGKGGDFLIVMPKGQKDQAGHGVLILQSGQTVRIDNAPGP